MSGKSGELFTPLKLVLDFVKWDFRMSIRFGKIIPDYVTKSFNSSFMFPGIENRFYSNL